MSGFKFEASWQRCLRVSVAQLLAPESERPSQQQPHQVESCLRSFDSLTAVNSVPKCSKAPEACSWRDLQSPDPETLRRMPGCRGLGGRLSLDLGAGGPTQIPAMRPLLVFCCLCLRGLCGALLGFVTDYGEDDDDRAVVKPCQ